jgi:hypothetical protein
MEQVSIGRFFVWTKHGHRPRKSHATHKSALQEAHRLAKKFPGHRFIVQEFHEKVFVDVEPSLTTDGKIATKMEMKMKSTQTKSLWAGVVNNQIQFFSENPDGNVQGLQGYRKFHISGNAELTDDNGNNLINSTSANLGQEDSGTVMQASDNTGPVGGAAQ